MSLIKKAMRVLALPVLAITLFIIGGISTPVMAQTTGDSALRCYVGGDPVTCTWHEQAIRSIGGDPFDPAQCFNIIGNTAQRTACRTQADIEQDEVNTDTQESAQQGIENPQRVTCDSTESCINDNPLLNFLVLILNLLGGAVAIIVVIVIVLAGIQYSTAGGNPNTTAAAKKRILNAIIAFVAYLGLYMVFQWLIPGGIV